MTDTKKRDGSDSLHELVRPKWTLHAMHDDYGLFYDRQDTGLRFPFGCGNRRREAICSNLNELEVRPNTEITCTGTEDA